MEVAASSLEDVDERLLGEDIRQITLYNHDARWVGSTIIITPTASREAVVGVLPEVASRLGAAAIDFPDEFRLGLLADGGPLDVQPMPRAYFCMHTAPARVLEAVADDVALNACDGHTAFV